MKKLLISGVLTSLLGFSAVPAQASAAVDAALGLGAFAVFNQLIGGVGLFGPGWIYGAPPYYPATYYPATYYPAPYYARYAGSYYAPGAVYAVPQTAPAPASASAQGQVVYPHGRYVLTGDGLAIAYRWVWVPNPPAGAPPPPPASSR